MAHPFETFEDLALAAAGVRGTTFLKPLAPPQPHAPPHGRRTAYLPYVREPDRLHTVTQTQPPQPHSSHTVRSGSARRRAQGPGWLRGGLYFIYTRHTLQNLPDSPRAPHT